MENKEKPKFKVGIDMAEKVNLAEVFEHEITEVDGEAFLMLKLPIDNEVLELFKTGTRVRKTMPDLRTIEKPDIRRGTMVVRMEIENDKGMDMLLDIRTEVQNKHNNG